MTPLRALLLTALAAPAAADPGPAVTAALDRFQTVCATALTDPDAYLATLTLPGAGDEPGRYTSPDGGYTLIHTSQSQGLTDYVELARLPGTDIRRCRITAVIADFPDAPVIDTALRPALAARAAALSGGEVANIEPIWEPGDDPVAYEGAPIVTYHATGLFPFDAIARISASSGGLELAVTREAAR